MTKVLMEYTGPKKAKTMASNLFKKMGKDKCAYNKLEYLYNDLKGYKVPPKRI